MKKRALSLLLAICLCLSVLPLTAHAAGFTKTRTYTAGMFTDLPEGKYYTQAVKDCYELGIISGTSADRFSPNSMYTVGQAVVVAARMHRLYNGVSGDLPKSDPYYQSAVDYCVKNGIITKDQFSSYKRNATRAEMATLLASALPDSAWTAINKVKVLPDVSTATDYNSDIFTLYNAGILTGSDNYGTFNPDAYITRADVAVMIQRCALPAQRKTFTLTPLSQRDAPEIVGKMNSYYWKVSNGLMRFQDSDTSKYGYVAANTGKVAIKAQYDHAEDFVGGFAKVGQNNKYGLINTKGTVTLALSYNYVDSMNYGVYTARMDYYGHRAVVINGKKATEFIYEYVSTNGVYIYGRIGTDNWDVMDMDGKKLTNIKAEPYLPPEGCSLFRVKSGNKWALANATGLVTEYIYDSIDLYKNCSLATAKYGNQSAILGPNGLVPGLGFGEYSEAYFNGDYVLIQNSEGWAFADANGIRSEYFPNSSFWGPRLSIWGDVLLCSAYENARFAYDMSTGKSQTVEGDMNRGYVLAADGSFIVRDGTKCEVVSDLGNNYYSFLTYDGKYGLLHNGNFASEGKYSSEDAAINAYNYYKSTSENGKPVILVGNDKKGWDTGMGIRYYKNQMYYDEIKSLGEGYYACRFNTTWFLLHA